MSLTNSCLLTLRLDKEVTLCYNGLGKFLHRVEVLCTITSDQIHFAERSPTNDLDQFEVIQTDFLIRSEQIFTCFLAIFIILGTCTIFHIIHGLGYNFRIILFIIGYEPTSAFSTPASRFYQ